MMKEITIEHLSSYLPHQPLMGWHDDGHRCVIDLQMVAKHGVGLANYKMCLRPLTQDIINRICEKHGLDFSYNASMQNLTADPNFDNVPHFIIRELLTAHVDIYGLLESGNAIDINTLTP
jgi:hypothetical protein